MNDKSMMEYRFINALEDDINEMQKWAETEKGFQYASEFCVNQWKNDLTWESWRIA